MNSLPGFGIFFPELIDDRGRRRFPFTPDEVLEEAQRAGVLKVLFAWSFEGQPDGARWYDLEPTEHGLMGGLRNLLGSISTPDWVLHSPHYNSLLGPLLNWGNMRAPADQPVLRVVRSKDPVEDFYYPAFLSLDRRMGFGYDVPVRWLGWPEYDPDETLSTHLRCHEQQATFASRLMRALRIRELATGRS